MNLTSAIIIAIGLAVAISLSSASAANANFSYDFSNINISRYTVRYLKSDGGRDTPECLQSQPYSSGCLQDIGNSIVYCQTLSYSLLENCIGQSTASNTDNSSLCVPNITSNLIILVHPGEYDYGETGITLYDYNNLIIRKIPGCAGKVSFTCKNFSDSVFNNLEMINTRNVGLDGLEFSRCGPLSSPCYMINVTNATITNCIFRDSLTSGFYGLSLQNMLFFNCTFQDNNSTSTYNLASLVNPYRHVAGGLTLIWRDESYVVQIVNCNFTSNKANINDQNINDTRPSLYIPRGHGGAIVLFFERTYNHTVIIENTIIVNNSAKFNGGGLLIIFSRKSNSNKVIIRETMFEGNMCNATGGAISMNTFGMANQNHLIVEKSHFISNKAWAGGGACTINIQDNQFSDSDMLIDNIGIFNNCLFMKNFSPSGGSTISLISNARVDQALNASKFTDCKFLENEADTSDGAITCFRFPIALLGNNTISSNKGGGLVLLQSRLDNYGYTIFENNTAQRGGAMELRDQSLIQVFDGTKIFFIGNLAEYKGGAISVSSDSDVGIDRDIIRLFNNRCFIQYAVGDVPISSSPYDWKVSFSFVNNTAKKDGAAIYATDIKGCTFVPNNNSETNSGSSEINSTNSIYEKSIFVIPGLFEFSGNEVIAPTTKRTVKRLATAPSIFRVEPQEVHGAPGEIIRLSISAVDQGDNDQGALWNINGLNEDEDNTNERYFSLKPGENFYYLHVCQNKTSDCSPGIKKDLSFSIVRPSVIYTTEVHVNVVGCHPGYNLSPSRNKCVLDQDEFILRPDGNNHYIYIKPQYYAEYQHDNDTNKTGSGVIVRAVIPAPFHYCTSDENNLNGCLFKYDQPYKQCTEGRTGFLCGQCPKGQGVDFTLLKCRECTVKGTIFVVIIILLFVLTCALVLVYNIGIPNELKGIFFFIQVVGFVYRYTDRETSWDFHLSRFFGSSLYLTICPLPGTNALYTAAYGFVLPSLATLTIIIYIISARFIRKLSYKNSFDGIWFLTFIIYKFYGDTCFSILRCQKVIGQNIPSKYVYFYDGSFKCFTRDDLEYLCFAVFALVIGIFVILFPAFILLISFKRFKSTQQLTDVLNNDLKISCRWWGSFDLFRRLLFIIVVLGFNYYHPLYNQLGLLFASLIVFFTFACAQPYNSRRANLFETFILLDLLVLTSLFLNTTPNHLEATRPYASILLLLPFLLLGIYIGSMPLIYAWNRWSPYKIKTLYLACKNKIGVTRTIKLQQSSSIDVELYETETSDEFISVIEGSSNEKNSELEYSRFREELLDEY